MMLFPGIVGEAWPLRRRCARMSFTGATAPLYIKGGPPRSGESFIETVEHATIPSGARPPDLPPAGSRMCWS